MNLLVAGPSITDQDPLQAGREREWEWTHHPDKPALWGLVIYANVRLLSCSTRRNEVEGSGGLTALGWT